MELVRESVNNVALCVGYLVIICSILAGVWVGICLMYEGRRADRKALARSKASHPSNVKKLLVDPDRKSTIIEYREWEAQVAMAQGRFRAQDQNARLTPTNDDATMQNAQKGYNDFL